MYSYKRRRWQSEREGGRGKLERRRSRPGGAIYLAITCACVCHRSPQEISHLGSCCCRYTTWRRRNRPLRGEVEFASARGCSRGALARLVVVQGVQKRSRKRTTFMTPPSFAQFGRRIPERLRASRSGGQSTRQAGFGSAGWLLLFGTAQLPRKRLLPRIPHSGTILAPHSDPIIVASPSSRH